MYTYNSGRYPHASSVSPGLASGRISAAAARLSRSIAVSRHSPPRKAVTYEGAKRASGIASSATTASARLRSSIVNPRAAISATTGSARK